MTLEEYRQARCPHGWVDVTQCEPCKTAAERDALRNEVDRLRVAAQAATELVDCLDELCAVVEGVVEDKSSVGSLIDSFTTQPARTALAKYKGAK